MIKFDLIKNIAQKYGIEVLSAIPVSKLNIALRKERSRLKVWQDNGYAANMLYMMRSPELLTTVENFLPSAKTVITLSLFYETVNELKEAEGKDLGKVARYAQGKDYHKVLVKKLNSLSKELKVIYTDLEYRAFTDSLPFLEKATAENTKLGFIGKNTLLIQEKKGSLNFLAEIMINKEVTEVYSKEIKASCGSCSRCLTACPTGALVSPYQLDANKCISYLTIEKREEFNEWEIQAIGEWIFGCDICQEVCPHNRRALSDNSLTDKNFAKAIGVGSSLNLSEIIKIKEDDEFIKRFNGTAIMRAKRAGLVRNAISVAFNKNRVDLIPLIQDAAINDESMVVKNTAKKVLQMFQEEKI